MSCRGLSGLYPQTPKVEVAADNENLEFYSGSGFSNTFSTPQYQADVVLDEHHPPINILVLSPR